MSFNNVVAKFKALLAIANQYKTNEEPSFPGYVFTIEHPSKEYLNGRILYLDDVNTETRYITMMLEIPLKLTT